MLLNQLVQAVEDNYQHHYKEKDQGDHHESLQVSSFWTIFTNTGNEAVAQGLQAETHESPNLILALRHPSQASCMVDWLGQQPSWAVVCPPPCERAVKQIPSSGMHLALGRGRVLESGRTGMVPR
eukprot:TRINITY_DN2361_c0_g1_i2.p1 TRINITY_DN2361_c0_g1~~TRINITY_DN2361_c0_g1_i2.p1  ORF type:complete len:125 (-),score=35.72 TRINITY_DN2361_c0_g1_i2:153-527(-)